MKKETKNRPAGKTADQSSQKDKEVMALLRKQGSRCISCMYGAIGGAVILIGSLLLIGDMSVTLVIAGCVAGLLLLAFSAKKYNKENNAYKKMFAEKLQEKIDDTIASFFGPDQAGDASDRTQLEDDLRASGLFAGWTKLSESGYRKGIRNGVPFGCRNLVLTKENPSGGEDAEAEKLFSGICLLCETRSPAPAPLTVEPFDKKNRSFYNAETGDPVFDEEFGLHCDGEVPEGLLLSKIVRNKLMELSAEGPVCAYFTENRLYILPATDQEFMNLEKVTKTRANNLEAMVASLKESLSYVAGILDRLSEDSVLFP